MQSLALYQLLQAAVLLLVGTLLYCLLFWRSTFLRWNRVLLWSILLASLILPFVQLPAAWTVQFWQKKEAITSTEPNLETGGGLLEPQFFFEINPAEQVTTPEVTENLLTKQPKMPITRLLFFLYGIGCFVFSIRFLIHLFSLFKLFRKAHLEQRDGYCLAFCQEELSPFAFGRTIFLSEALLQSAELELILTHELAHVRQRHTLDILAAELMLVWQWFNPGAWLYRRLVETNLEYLADRCVLQQQWDKKQYQLSLLNWLNASISNRLSTSYNFSLLKERIMMMNRKPSSNLYLLRYAAMGMMLPTFILFNKPSQAIVTVKASNQFASQMLDNKPVSKPPNLVNLPAPRPQEKIPMKQKPILSATPTQDTAKEEEFSFMLIVNPNLDAAQQEKIRNEKFPLGKKLELTKNGAGRITGARMVNESGGNCYTSHEANDDLPIVLYGGRNSCGTGTFDTDVLDKLIANQWPKTIKVMTYGIPSDPLLLEAYRIKILSAKELYTQERLKFLASKNWIVSNANGSTSYRIPVKEDTWSRVKKQVQIMTAEGKPYVVIVNGYTYQSELPNIELSKITKMIVHDETTTEYIEGTLNVKKHVQSGLRVEISLE